MELVKKVAEVKVTKVEKDDGGQPKFKKRIIKKSPNADSRRPNKGEKIGCYYIGRLDGPDGKIFDQLQPQRRGSQTLNFKVGTGRVIRGFERVLVDCKNSKKYFRLGRGAAHNAGRRSCCCHYRARVGVRQEGPARSRNRAKPDSVVRDYP